MPAAGDSPVLVRAARRAKDPVARVLALSAQVGVKYAIEGAVFRVVGADGLHPEDRALLRDYSDVIRTRLEGEPPDDDLLERFGADVELVTAAVRAREVIANLTPDVRLGFDTETSGAGPRSPGWIKITRTGRRARAQPRPTDNTALDVTLARPRLAQIFDPAARVVYIFDLYRVPVGVLQALEDRRMWVHNLAYDDAVLARHGIHLRSACCTLVLARLTFGAERGGLKLAQLADRVLGIDLAKYEQASAWDADRLSESQLRYAAGDAIVVQKLGQTLWEGLDRGCRRAYGIAKASVVPVARMRLAGIPFCKEIHAQTLAGWEQECREARAEFIALEGADIPRQGLARSTWLEQRIPPEMLERWPRTKGGLLRQGRDFLDRLAAIPSVRPLLRVLAADKLIRSFGSSLLARATAEGRLHMDLKPAATKTGRCSCSSPNLQQLPQSVRAAVIAPAGYTFVIADYNQIEMRIAAELSSDGNMVRIFQDGQDMHQLNAAAFVGCEPENVLKVDRNKAKRTGFGTIYGITARGLVANIWSMYRVEVNEIEAQRWIDQFYARYPRLRQWQQENYTRASRTGVIRSICGRPLRAEWEYGELRWQKTCNFPVQSSAAEVMLKAMARVHRALEGTGARLLLQIHDELLCEAPEGAAERAAGIIEAQMVAAYEELFPSAPVLGLVDVASRTCWAKPEE